MWVLTTERIRFCGAGRQFLDFYAGIAVSGIGHSDADWYKALVDAGKVRADCYWLAWIHGV